MVAPTVARRPWLTPGVIRTPSTRRHQAAVRRALNVCVPRLEESPLFGFDTDARYAGRHPLLCSNLTGLRSRHELARRTGPPSLPQQRADPGRLAGGSQSKSFAFRSKTSLVPRARALGIVAARVIRCSRCDSHLWSSRSAAAAISSAAARSNFSCLRSSLSARRCRPATRRVVIEATKPPTRPPPMGPIHAGQLASIATPK